MRWFELPSKFSLNLDQIRSELALLKWITYGDNTGTPGARPYHGIGLTCRKNSLTPELDALQVYQEIRPDAPAFAHPFNWQEMGELTENARGYIRHALFSIGLPPGKARFGKLSHGRKIPVHHDDYCENIIRVHWPIETDEHNLFVFYDNLGVTPVESIHMASGRAYAIDPNIPHAFENQSKTVDRVHLIVNFNMTLPLFYNFICNERVGR